MLEGLVAGVPNLLLLDGLPDVKVVYDGERDPSKVALISGGGSGHEPAHAGYVGRGMLTAAVCGDVFTSPPSEAVLAAIRTVCGPAGCLLIVKRYTGDLLHFGLAAEQAKAEGFRVEMVVVGDDCALRADGIAGRRGLAGTIFVHKVAGALADQGRDLDAVTVAARKVAQNIGTMGVAMDVCTLPGASPSDRLGPDEIELGLGIHGEPGARKAAYHPADAVVQSMLQHILQSESAYLPVEEGEVVAVLVNNLGGLSAMELHIVTRAALKYLTAEAKVDVARLYVGSYMTSIDMAGVSLTVFRVSNELLLQLDRPTSALGWGSGTLTCIPSLDKLKTPVPKGINSADVGPVRPATLTPQGQLMETAITAVCDALIDSEADLNAWDSQAGDGDCGLTMRKGAEAIKADMAGCYALNDPRATTQQLAASVRRSMGGTSGALYDIFFTAASNAIPAGEATLSPQQWARALGDGVSAMQAYGGANKGHRTMLDALLPAVGAMKGLISEPAIEVLGEMADAARAGADATTTMKALAGRSSYVPEDVLQSVPDPGAQAVAIWLKAIYDAVKAHVDV
ncbi:unnamed protein product [Ostreobium quekettii]|uniref:Uncharacterized protein n=1 Tax=Ostreobium quekettii TaxID=121088 RepID=A0A8S1IZ61_9CHLO|nr:unnamed protein product [Ostreobium quekettii]